MPGLPINLHDDKQKVLTIKPKDARGNDAPIDGAPVWSTSNSELVTLTPSADGLSCTVTPVGPLGTCTISVTGDADLGPGVKAFTGSRDVMITGDGAVTFEIEEGAETDIPPAGGPPLVP
jgi:hypothetical protein